MEHLEKICKTTKIHQTGENVYANDKCSVITEPGTGLTINEVRSEARMCHVGIFIHSNA